MGNARRNFLLACPYFIHPGLRGSDQEESDGRGECECSLHFHYNVFVVEEKAFEILRA